METVASARKNQKEILTVPSRPAPTAIPNEVRRQRSTSVILDVAEQLFVESGYAATSVDRVAAAAGLTKGAVYFYFSSKEGLLDALITRAEQTTFAPPMAILDEREAPALDRIARFFNFQGASIGRARRYLVVLTVSLQRDAAPPGARRRADALFATVRERIAGVIAEGQADGTIAAHLQPREAAALVQSMIEGMLLQWLRRSGGLDGGEFLRTGRRVLLAGLLAR